MTEWKGWCLEETVGIAICNCGSVPCIDFADDADLTNEQISNMFDAMEQKDVYACIRFKGKLYRSKQDVVDAGI